MHLRETFRKPFLFYTETDETTRPGQFERMVRPFGDTAIADTVEGAASQFEAVPRLKTRSEMRLALAALVDRLLPRRWTIMSSLHTLSSLLACLSSDRGDRHGVFEWLRTEAGADQEGQYKWLVRRAMARIPRCKHPVRRVASFAHYAVQRAPGNSRVYVFEKIAQVVERGLARRVEARPMYAIWLYLGLQCFIANHLHEISPRERAALHEICVRRGLGDSARLLREGAEFLRPLPGVASLETLAARVAAVTPQERIGEVLIHKIYPARQIPPYQPWGYHLEDRLAAATTSGTRAMEELLPELRARHGPDFWINENHLQKYGYGFTGWDSALRVVRTMHRPDIVPSRKRGLLLFQGDLYTPERLTTAL